MAGMSLTFLCLGYVFDMAALLSPYTFIDYTSTAVLLTTLLQFFMGVLFSIVATGYYSLVMLVSVEKESAMSTIEAGKLPRKVEV